MPEPAVAEKEAEAAAKAEPTDDERLNQILADREAARARGEDVDDEGDDEKQAAAAAAAAKKAKSDEGEAPKVSIKHRAEERDYTQEELIDLAQKGLLYNDKQHEIAERLRELDAGEPPAKQPSGEATSEGGDGQLQAYIKGFTDDLNKVVESNPDVLPLAQRSYELLSHVARLDGAVRELTDWKAGRDSESAVASEDAALQREFEQLNKLAPDLSEDDMLDVYLKAAEVDMQGHLVHFYRSENMEKLVEKAKQEALDEGEKTAKQKREASIRAGARLRDSDGKFITRKDWDAMSEEEQNLHFAKILDDRDAEQ
jgi:hypothetical protein